MVKVKKLHGEFPENVVVLDKVVAFDTEGISEVEDQDVLDVLVQVPGYEVEGTSEDAEEEESSEDVGSEEVLEEAPTAKPAPKSPKRPAAPKTK